MKRWGYLKRRTPLKKQSSGFSVQAKAKHVTEMDLKRQYDVPDQVRLRYKGLKGILWYWFSRYVRVRDFLKYGTCISGGERIRDWRDADCGHYVAASHCGFGLLFDERNNNLQCKTCNNPLWSPDSSAGYSHGLDARYGEGTAKALWDRRHDTTKEWSQAEYVVKIKHYHKRFQTLSKRLP